MDTSISRRHARLRDEIEDDLGLKLPAEAIEEIDYARAPPVHEGRAPSYGAIIEEADPDGQLHLPLAGTAALAQLTDISNDLGMLRRLADGYSSFLWRQPEGSLLLHPVSPDELALVGFQHRFGVIVVRRSAAGHLRLYSQRGLASFEGGRWTSRPYGHGYTAPIAHLLRLSSGTTRILGRVLDFCVHVVSPAHVGATLVYPLSTGSPGDLDRSAAVSIPSLNVTLPTAHGPLKSLLSQVDRATPIRPDGFVDEVGVGLVVTEGSANVVVPGGTRHNSAIRYSSQQPDVLVIVVSADGPVTVFHDGESLVSDEEALYVQEWVMPCYECRGTGCEDCDETGYQVVEEYVDRVRHADAVQSHPPPLFSY